MTAWRGRYGAVLLGPTEDRVARYLEAATRAGRVTIPTTRLVAELNLARSEAYRITRTLRTLGLFGVENDQGGTRGGRRYWRITTRQGELEATRHRVAWARVTAWLKAQRARLLAAIPRNAQARPPGLHRPAEHAAKQPGPTGVEGHPVGSGPPSLRDAMLALAPGLAAAWRLADAS